MVPYGRTQIKIMVETKLLPGYKIARKFWVWDIKCKHRKCFIQGFDGHVFMCKTLKESGYSEKFKKAR